MKLELKHIAPYFPYGLKYMCEIREEEDAEPIHKGISTLIDIDFDSGFYALDVEDFGCVEFAIWDLKPVLRPLSDLTKEIEVNGDRFVPIEFIQKQVDYKAFVEVNFDGELLFKGKNECYCFGYTDVYSAYQKLFEWHFDVFGLIEKGLAIDINTLND